MRLSWCTSNAQRPNRWPAWTAIFNSYRGSLERVEGAESIDEIAALMAEEVKHFTGFDRVMVYRFAEDFSGEVIAEEREEEMEPYLGLRYPASDIPPQARELYRTNLVRLLRDVDAEPVAIMSSNGVADAAKLDLGKSVLRAMSPVHLQYLRNMGVASSLTISLISGGALWGLIACHHREPKFVSYGVRATASFYATVMGAQIETKRASFAERAAARARELAGKVLSGIPGHVELEDCLGEMLPDICKVFGPTVLHWWGARAR